MFLYADFCVGSIEKILAGTTKQRTLLLVAHINLMELTVNNNFPITASYILPIDLECGCDLEIHVVIFCL